MRCTTYVLVFSLVCVSTGFTTGAYAGDRWHAPFDSATLPQPSGDTALTFDEVLGLVRDQNPLLQSLEHRLQAAQSQVHQVGLWSNPAFMAEFEEVGLDAPGFSESEVTLALSQEFELFGQRSARMVVAEAGVDAHELEATLIAFDLFLEAKSRYLTLAHAQERLLHAESFVSLTDDILGNIEFRISRGAALQSEFLLAQLESQRIKLERDESRQEVEAASVSLAALWNDHASTLRVVSSSEPDLALALSRIEATASQADSTRDVLTLTRQSDVLRAERHLARAEVKPRLTLTGGYRRSQASGLNSLVFGIELPLPLWNRNQGALRSLDAQLRSLNLEIAQARADATALLLAGAGRLRQLLDRHARLDSQLLPIAEEAYQTLQTTYEAGRLPYTSLLQAERSLVELRLEHNDMLLAIHDQIMALERTTGTKLYTPAD